MSAIFGEIIVLGQAKGPDIQLRVTGDEFYSVYETLDGFTAVSDEARGCYCYAYLYAGMFASSGVPVTSPPPQGIARHLRESVEVRNNRFEARRKRGLSLLGESGPGGERTFGPSQGLLSGRRLSSGKVRGLTILVHFKDVKTQVTADEVRKLLNGPGKVNANFCSVFDYFKTVSTGKLEYTNDVVGPYTLSQDRSYYVKNLLVKEALDLAVAAGVDLQAYDSRGQGILDALNIMYAGQTQYDGDLWPHNSVINLRYGRITTNLYMLTSAGRTNADLSIGTFCHESGHLVCRFPDMYDYGDINREGDGVKSAGIGVYCLMGSGNHLDSGRTPAPVSAYLRDLVGWCDNVVDLNAASDVQLVHGRYDTIYKFSTGAPNEYFLLENRSKLGLDRHLPSSGLAVYHCDILGSNEFQQGTAQRHYQCALLQADGRADLENNVNTGDGTDLFSKVNGVAVSNETKPSSRSWNGGDSGLVISEVSVPGTEIGVRLGRQASNVVQGSSLTKIAIPDNAPAGIRSVIQLPEGGLVGRLVVHVHIDHSYIGDLRVVLVGPTGVRSVLHEKTGAGKDDLIVHYDSATVPSLAGQLGIAVGGDWVLEVSDLAGSDIGKLDHWTLDATIDSDTTPKTLEAQPKLAIPDNNQIGVSSNLTVQRSGVVGRIAVAVDITHTYIGDLRIELIAPEGRKAVLHGQLGGGHDNLKIAYDSATPLSVLKTFIGVSMRGNWILRVVDVAGQDTGTLDGWSLTIEPALG